MNGTWFLSSRHVKSIRQTEIYKIKLSELLAINRKANSTSLSLKTAYTPGKASRVPFIMERRKAEIQAWDWNQDSLPSLLVLCSPLPPPLPFACAWLIISGSRCGHLPGAGRDGLQHLQTASWSTWEAAVHESQGRALIGPILVMWPSLSSRCHSMEFCDRPGLGMCPVHGQRPGKNGMEKIPGQT